jgi:hippurate hydrolase
VNPKYQKYEKRIREIKQDLHRHPEVSLKEFRTTEVIKRELLTLGAEVIDLGLPTGVLAVLKGKRPGLIALRADIDALQLTEETGAPDASETPGVMHGCGHDLHTASLLGAAMILSELRDEIPDVAFIFQPAEEITSGAELMIEHGLFDKIKPDMLFGIHNVPEIPVGKVGLKLGALMSAKDNFEIRISGVGGHGGLPHKTVDPIVCAASVISSVQSIVSRNTDPREAAVVSVCSIHAGTPENLITDELFMTGSIRALSDGVMEQAKRRLQKIVASTAEAYGCGSLLKFNGGPPALVNRKDMYGIARDAAEKILGQDAITDPVPSMGSEDFAVLMKHVPGFFYFLGSGSKTRENYPWHSSKFRPDEGYLMIAAELYAQSVLSAAMRGAVND